MIDLKRLWEIYEIAQRYRDGEAHIAVAQTFPLASGHHPTENLDGNLGALLFIGADGAELGRNWIAPSRKLRSEVRSRAAQLGDALLHYCADGTIARNEANSNTQVALTFPPSGGHGNDSECVLLNTLYAELHSAKRDTGEVWLLTERLPCPSCTAIIVAFKLACPGIAMHVMCLADYVNSSTRRSHVEFYQEVAQAKVQVHLYKFDRLSEGECKATAIPADAPLLGYSTAHIREGAPRFAGVVNGKRVMTTWTAADAHELRLQLMIAPAKTAPAAGSDGADGSDGAGTPPA